MTETYKKIALEKGSEETQKYEIKNTGVASITTTTIEQQEELVAGLQAKLDKHTAILTELKKL